MRSFRVSTAMIPFLAMAVLVLPATSFANEKNDDEGWISLFDGRSLDGWKASENPEQWKVKDGTIVASGPRSHLFYMGDDENNPPKFKSFRFKADVMTTPGSNSGIYFHVKFQNSGWPRTGFEAQVNNSHGDPVRTGSIYHLAKNFEPPAKDNEWFTQEIVVDAQKKNVQTHRRVHRARGQDGHDGSVRPGHVRHSSPRPQKHDVLQEHQGHAARLIEPVRSKGVPPRKPREKSVGRYRIAAYCPGLAVARGGPSKWSKSRIFGTNTRRPGSIMGRCTVIAVRAPPCARRPFWNERSERMKRHDDQ